MERFALNYENHDEPVLDPVFASQEVLANKLDATDSFMHTVAHTDGLAPLLQLMVSNALPFL